MLNGLIAQKHGFRLGAIALKDAELLFGRRDGRAVAIKLCRALAQGCIGPLACLPRCDTFAGEDHIPSVIRGGESRRGLRRRGARLRLGDERRLEDDLGVEPLDRCAR